MPNNQASRIQSTPAIIIDEDQLIPVQPLLHHSHTILSPPATNNFDFPSLLDSLSESQIISTMPSPYPWSDEVDNSDEIFCQSISHQQTSLPSSDAINAASIARTKSQQSSSYDECEELQAECISEVDIMSETSLYSLQSIIEEARSHYRSMKPEFCVKTPDTKVRKIQLINRRQQTAEIWFEEWETGIGYWIYTDEINDAYIVKWQGGKYFVWEGVTKGFSLQPFATAVKRAVRSSPEASVPNVTVMRERTVRQLLPYSMYNAEKVQGMKGITLSEKKLEQIVQNRSTRLKSNPKLGNHKKGIIVSAPESTRSLSPATTVEPTDGEVLQRTRIRTRFNGFEKATIPIPAERCPSHEELFAVLKNKWAFQLQDRILSYCIVEFPWHGDDKNLLLQESDNEGFAAMLDEVRRCPHWSSAVKVEILIEIYTA